MKKLLIAAALMLCCLPSFAQQLQTLYYPDGKKLMEGRWRYVNALIGSVSGLLSDADYNYGGFIRLAGPYEREDVFDFRKLNLRCDGPVTIWYKDGTVRTKITFADGIENGPFIAYYANGNKALEGWLEGGMPQGLWKSYYFKGGLHFTATYRPYTQAELDKNCTALLQYKYRAEIPDNLDTMSTAAAQFTYSLRHAFEQLIPVPANSVKNGAFVYYNEDGSREAEIFFKDDLRDGVWTRRRTAHLPPVHLVYAAGRLMYITDSTGRYPLQAYAKREKRAWERGLKGTGGVVVEPEVPAQIFRFVEQPAVFPGNVEDFVRKNIRYPHHIKDYIDSYTTLQFFVEEDGSVSSVSITKSAYPELDEELVRVLKAMPRWRPGRHDGHPVRTGVSVNFSFGMKVNLIYLK